MSRRTKQSNQSVIVQQLYLALERKFSPPKYCVFSDQGKTWGAAAEHDSRKRQTCRVSSEKSRATALKCTDITVVDVIKKKVMLVVEVEAPTDSPVDCKDLAGAIALVDNCPHIDIGKDKFSLRGAVMICVAMDPTQTVDGSQKGDQLEWFRSTFVPAYKNLKKWHLISAATVNDTVTQFKELLKKY